MFALLGSPGSGKSTLARALCSANKSLAHFNIRAYSRILMNRGDPLVAPLEAMIASRSLYPDAAVAALYRDFLSGLSDNVQTVLVESYPKTAAQCQDFIALSSSHQRCVSGIVRLDVPNNIIVNRLANRAVCGACDYPTNINAGQCETCGGNLQRRPDDEIGRVEQRMAFYRDELRTLNKHLVRQSTLYVVDGNQRQDVVMSSVAEIVEGRVPATTREAPND